MKLGTFESHMEDMCRQREISPEQAAEQLRSWGIRDVCVGSDWIGDPVREREKLDGLGLTVSDVFGQILFLTGKDIPGRIEELLERTRVLGAERLLITTEEFRDRGDPALRREDDALAAEGLALAAEMAERCGVRIVVENYDVNAGPLTFGSDLRKILEQAGNVGFAFDSGNFVHPGEDEVESLRTMKQWLGGVVHFKDRRLESYLPAEEADFHENLTGVRYYPSPVGKGIIRFREIRDILREENFDGEILLEHFGASDQYAYLEESAAFVKSLFPEL